MKHTPGPWKVMYATKDYCALAVWRDNTIEGSIGSTICKVSPIEDETEEDRANAKLIAAAPELLEALVKAKKFLRDLVPEAYESSIVGPAIDNAIKKATT